jgi:hypothetical protein
LNWTDSEATGLERVLSDEQDQWLIFDDQKEGLRQLTTHL